MVRMCIVLFCFACDLHQTAISKEYHKTINQNSLSSMLQSIWVMPLLQQFPECSEWMVVHRRCIWLEFNDFWIEYYNCKYFFLIQK